MKHSNTTIHASESYTIPFSQRDGMYPWSEKYRTTRQVDWSAWWDKRMSSLETRDASSIGKLKQESLVKHLEN